MDNWKRRIGKKIKRRRIEMGFATQADLARALEIDQSRVSRWETGEHIPAKHKADLYRILEIDDNYLRDESQKPTEDRAQLILRIIESLPALNDSELGAIFDVIKISKSVPPNRNRSSS